MSFGRPSRDRFEGSVILLKSVFTAFHDPAVNRIRDRYRLHPTALGWDAGDIGLCLSFDYFDHNCFIHGGASVSNQPGFRPNPNML